MKYQYHNFIVKSYWVKSYKHNTCNTFLIHLQFSNKIIFFFVSDAPDSTVSLAHFGKSSGLKGNPRQD